MNSSNDFRRLWLEFWGRRRPAPRYLFPNDQIVTEGTALNVSAFWGGTYINLHHTLYALAEGPDGRAVHLRGGYNPLPPGYYTLHYVDKQDRVFEMPRLTERTRDGAQISMDLIVTYRVIDPIRAFEVQQPVSTLMTLISSDLKEFIRCHNYDDIIGDNQEQTVKDELFSNHIKDQHSNRHQLSRLFLIENIGVKEKIGDPRLTEIREDFQVKARQTVANSELTRQNQELEKRVASQDAEIRRIKAKSDADQQMIAQKMKMQSLEFDQARAEMQYRQDIMIQAMKAIGQALAGSAYPTDARQMQIIKDIIAEFRGQPGLESISETVGKSPAAPAQPTAFNAEKVSSLTETLLNWNTYKRP